MAPKLLILAVVLIAAGQQVFAQAPAPAPAPSVRLCLAHTAIS
jgi:hypothetical protein